MTLAGLLLFASVYLAAVASPGPGLAAVVARGLVRGREHGAFFVAGVVIGDLVWFTLAATGLSVITARFEILFLAIKFAGCGYLLWMAWRIWTAPVRAADIAAAPQRGGAWPAFLGSLSLTLGNPKVIVFFLSIMPLVIDPGAISPLVFAEMAAVIVLVITPVMAGALLLADRAGRVFRSERALRRINRGTAVVMAGAAVAIATR
jgi:threonine/homoserine/homoserine lactone efflux protein